MYWETCSDLVSLVMVKGADRVEALAAGAVFVSMFSSSDSVWYLAHERIDIEEASQL